MHVNRYDNQRLAVTYINAYDEFTFNQNTSNSATTPSIGLESNGCPCMPLHGEEPSEEWRQEVLQAMDSAAASTSHVFKPYRDEDALLQHLRKMR